MDENKVEGCYTIRESDSFCKCSNCMWRNNISGCVENRERHDLELVRVRDVRKWGY